MGCLAVVVEGARLARIWQRAAGVVGGSLVGGGSVRMRLGRWCSASGFEEGIRAKKKFLGQHFRGNSVRDSNIRRTGGVIGWSLGGWGQNRARITRRDLHGPWQALMRVERLSSSGAALAHFSDYVHQFLLRWRASSMFARQRPC